MSRKIKASLLTLTIVCLLGFASVVWASSNEMTTAAPDAQYELVQSNLSAKLTLRVNKYVGSVSQLMEGPGGVLFWRPVGRSPHKQDNKVYPGKANYQFFTSGLSVKYSYLMNVNTGATWVLTQGSNGVLSFAPIY